MSFITGKKLNAPALSEAQKTEILEKQKWLLSAHDTVFRGSTEFDRLYEKHNCGVEERRYPMAQYDVESPPFSTDVEVVRMDLQPERCYPDKFIAAFLVRQ